MCSCYLWKTHEPLPAFSLPLSVIPTFSSGGAHPEYLPENEHLRTFLLALILKLSFTNYFVFPSSPPQPHPVNPTEPIMYTSYALCPNSFWSKSYKKLFFLVFSSTMQIFLLFFVSFKSSSLVFFLRTFLFLLSYFIFHTLFCFAWIPIRATSALPFYFSRMGCFFPLYRDLICICPDFFLFAY